MNELAVIPRQEAVEITRWMPVMSIDDAVARRRVIVEATQKLMQGPTEENPVGVDYGKIPGSEKPTLLQPGADKLCNLFGLVVRYEIVKSIEDWTGQHTGGEPQFYYQVRGQAWRGDMLMGEGIGSCSSWESKYRYRKGERKCPACGVEAIIKGRAEYGGGWLCYLKKGGCGSKFKDGDASIESQETGRKPNADIFDQINTIQKIAFKRAKISTTINATSASEFFTQDIEELTEHAGPVPVTPTGLASPAGTTGTTETQEQVKARRLEEERGAMLAQKDAAGKGKGNGKAATKPAVVKPTEVPSTTDWRKAAWTEFNKLEGQMTSELFQHALRHLGIEKLEDIPDRDTAVRAYHAIRQYFADWRAEQERRADVPGTFAASDDDLPQGLFDRGTADRTPYQEGN